MEGIDRESVFLLPGQARLAYYKKLQPGVYTFKVTACNSDGVWNQTEDSLTFKLKPYFHQTFIFKLVILFLIVLTAGAGFYIYRRRYLQKRIKYKDSQLSPDFAGESIEKLKYLMEDEKVYLDAEISLQTLAEKMDISPHQLSQLLNEKMDRNFYDFVNRYRVEEAKRILQSTKGTQRKISAIAIEVGFNTMAAFYKAFKKITGVNPSDYR